MRICCGVETLHMLVQVHLCTSASALPTMGVTLKTNVQHSLVMLEKKICTNAIWSIFHVHC